MQGVHRLDEELVRNRSILVVDDESDIRGSLSRLLAAAFRGITVDVAEHGQAGLDAVKSAGKPYDIILSDYRMPGLDGIEFLHKCMKKTPASYRVMMTAFPDRELSQLAHERADVEAFLTKPLDPSSVLMTITELLQQRIEDEA